MNCARAWAGCRSAVQSPSHTLSMAYVRHTRVPPVIGSTCISHCDDAATKKKPRPVCTAGRVVVGTSNRNRLTSPPVCAQGRNTCSRPMRRGFEASPATGAEAPVTRVPVDPACAA